MFGKVVEGMEVVDRISVSPTSAKGPFKQDAPIAEVVIQKIEIIGDSPAAATAPAEAPAAPPADAPAEGAGQSAPRPAEGAPPAGSTPPK